MDWSAWGEDEEMAVEEFAFAIRRGWRTLSAPVNRILSQWKNGEVDAEEAFALLQDLVPESG